MYTSHTQSLITPNLVKNVMRAAICNATTVLTLCNWSPEREVLTMWNQPRQKTPELVSHSANTGATLGVHHAQVKNLGTPGVETT